jgi:poly(hydroxyalkanoate) granule-associated protein
MVKKLKSKADETNLSQGVMNFTHQVWLAGLGAFSMIEEEGGKLFENLVKEGEKFEARAKKLADDKVEGVKDNVEEMRDKATDTWDKVEEVFESRMASILNRLGIPTSDDIEDLSKRVEALQESVKKLTKNQA